MYRYEKSPPDDFPLEWDTRWVELHADGLWHADGLDNENHLMVGDVGKLDLALVDAADLEESKTLVLAQQGKCHLLRADEKSAVDLDAWHETISAELRQLRASV